MVGGVDGIIQDLLNSFNDVLAVLGRVDDPTDCFLKLLPALCLVSLVKALVTVHSEHLFDDLQYVKQ